VGIKYKHIKIKQKDYRVHRIIYKLHNPEWDIDDYSNNNLIDHIDRNPLNNDIGNLRVVTHQQNQWNTKAKGYSWDKTANKWRVKIMIGGKHIDGGYFETEEEAIKKRAELKQQYHHI
tara:strand:+ start:198 stop:551 length:354 start_codon:yes stop_codon:yes gene_type:complete